MFGAAIDAGYTWLAVIGILNSVLALAVYLRIIVVMYQQPTNEETSAVLSKNLLLSMVWGGMAAVSLLAGLGAQIFLGVMW